MVGMNMQDKAAVSYAEHRTLAKVSINESLD